jgi:outer membrane protein assembly factor BamB
MKSRHILAITLGATLVFLGAGCRNEVPPRRPVGPLGPDHTWTGIPTTYTVSAHIDRGTIRYVMDWGDLVDTTDASYASGETATITHVWTAPGTMIIKVMAINSAAHEKASLWSWPESVDVILDSLPVVDTVEAPSVAMRGVEVHFVIRASDPEGDSIKVHIDWGDGKDTTTDLHGGPYYFGFYPSHTFAQVETAKMVVVAQDLKGATSLPETVFVRVDTTGGVIWSYAVPWASPLVVNDGVEDCIYYGFVNPFWESFFAAFTEDGVNKYGAPPESAPAGGVAYCAASQHVVGWGGALWALDRQLHVAWRLETSASSGWGDPAVSGDRIYLGNDNDTLYCFIDSVDHGVRAAAFPTKGTIDDAPVIDAQGDVYFCTDSGYLYKLGPGLDTVYWRTCPAEGGRIRSSIIGGDGTIYCATAWSRLYAIDPSTGTSLWTVTLGGQPARLAMGRTAIFFGTEDGKAYSVNPATGTTNWWKTLSPGHRFITAPVVTADGCVYFQNDRDILYRVNQADGTVIWECDCSYLGWGEFSYPGKWRPVTGHAPNSTILSNGNIIVAGSNATYCVAGSPQGPLDPLAPWPKWQHDLYNTGCVGGGR